MKRDEIFYYASLCAAFAVALLVAFAYDFIVASPGGALSAARTGSPAFSVGSSGISSEILYAGDSGARVSFGSEAPLSDVVGYTVDVSDNGQSWRHASLAFAEDSASLRSQGFAEFVIVPSRDISSDNGWLRTTLVRRSGKKDSVVVPLRRADGGLALGEESVPICGNRVLEQGETCDPPGSDCDATSNDDICTDACKCEYSGGPRCGNGVKEAGESCDDGNRKDGDGCSAACSMESCSCKAIEVKMEGEAGGGVKMPFYARGPRPIPLDERTTENAKKNEKTLGPSLGRIGFYGARYRSGWNFVVEAKVEGDPSLCKEGQFVKNTRVQGNGEIWHSGTKDELTSTFRKTPPPEEDDIPDEYTPFDGEKYSLDGYTETIVDTGRLKDNTSVIIPIKEHAVNEDGTAYIRWIDGPAIMAPVPGYGLKGDAEEEKKEFPIVDRTAFKSVITGTDGSYCACEFSLYYDVNADGTGKQEVLSKPNCVVK